MTDPIPIGARLDDILRRIAQDAPHLEGVAIGDPNGLPIASSLEGPTTLPATALSVMALEVTGNVSERLGLPGQARIRIEGEGWEVVVRPLDAGFTFIAILRGPVTEDERGALEAHLPEVREAIRALIDMGPSPRARRPWSA